MFSKLFDGIAAIGQNAGISVDVSDRRVAGSSREKPRVKSIDALTDQTPNIHNVEPLGSLQNWKVNRLTINNHLNGVFHSVTRRGF